MDWKRASAFALAMTAVAAAAPAALTASATLQLASTGGTQQSPTYTYDLVLHNTGNTTIGSFWFSWVPGQDYLKTSPISVADPAGWGHQITTGGQPGVNNGYAILWTASSTAAETAAGGTLSGFRFTSADDPASISGTSVYYPTTAVETAFVYQHGIFSDAGYQLVVQTVPEPVLLSGLPILLMLRRRWR